MKKKNLLYFIFLLLVPAVHAATDVLSSILEPLGGANFAGIYDSYWQIIDFIIYLVIFLAVARFTFRKWYEKEERSAKAISAGIGIVLALSLVIWGSNNNFRISNLGPFSAVLLLAIIVLAIFITLKDMFGLNGRYAFAWAFLFSYYLLQAIFKPLWLWLETNAPLVIGLLGIVLLICIVLVILSIITFFGKKGEQTTTTPPTPDEDHEKDEVKNIEREIGKEQNVTTEVNNGNNININQNQNVEQILNQMVNILNRMHQNTRIGDHINGDKIIEAIERLIDKAIERIEGKLKALNEKMITGLGQVQIIIENHLKELLINMGKSEAEMKRSVKNLYEKITKQEQILIRNIKKIYKEIHENQKRIEEVDRKISELLKKSKTASKTSTSNEILIIIAEIKRLLGESNQRHENHQTLIKNYYIEIGKLKIVLRGIVREVQDIKNEKIDEVTLSGSIHNACLELNHCLGRLHKGTGGAVKKGLTIPIKVYNRLTEILKKNQIREHKEEAIILIKQIKTWLIKVIIPNAQELQRAYSKADVPADIKTLKDNIRILLEILRS